MDPLTTLPVWPADSAPAPEPDPLEHVVSHMAEIAEENLPDDWERLVLLFTVETDDNGGADLIPYAAGANAEGAGRLFPLRMSVAQCIGKDILTLAHATGAVADADMTRQSVLYMVRAVRTSGDDVEVMSAAQVVDGLPDLTDVDLIASALHASTDPED